MFVKLLLLFLSTLVTADSDINSRIRIACARIAEDNLYLFSHENNLFQYWRCLNNNITLMNCYKGYQFNESDQSCKVFSEKTTYKDEYDYVIEDEDEDEAGDEDEDEDEGKDEDEDGNEYEDEDVDIDVDENKDKDVDVDEFEYEDGDLKEVDGKVKNYEEDFDYGYIESILSSTQLSTITLGIVQPSPCSKVPHKNIVLQKHALFSVFYWKCVGSIPFKQSCLDGSYFNEERQLCDDYLFLNGTRNDPKCANTDFAYMPHSFDCTKFVKCYLNQSYEGECPIGFHFDKNENKCKHAASVQCMVDARCNNNKEFIKFFPHPTSCSKFIECYDFGQISYVRECAEGHTFNAMRRKCIDRHISGAEDCSVTEPPWAIPESVCSNVPEGEVILKKVSTDECNFYWECKGTSQTLKRCPEKLLFNEEQQLCSANTRCYSPISTKLYAWTPQPFLTSLSVYEHPMCQNNGNQRRLLSHPRDCSKFIECVRYEAVERKCPQGLYFDSLFQKCRKFIFSSCTK